MSIRIIKEGLLDTIQDGGRRGRQHLGISPGGAMDPFSSKLANALLGKELSAPVIEMHFPAAQLLFEQPAIISICGADFTPLINKHPVPTHHPIAVAENSLLQFTRMQHGARVYIAMLPEMKLTPWEGSYSTNLQAGVGGLNGKALKRYDVIPFQKKLRLDKILGEKEYLVLPWKAVETVEDRNRIQCIIGTDWHTLHPECREEFGRHWYQISRDSDRMGYRLLGQPLRMTEELVQVASGVGFGTVQWLPGGNMIVLMADHQTAGVFPKIVHVIAAHLPLLAQKKPGDVFHFELTDLPTAEEKHLKQQQYLAEIGIACKFRMENLLHDL